MVFCPKGMVTALSGIASTRASLTMVDPQDLALEHYNNLLKNVVKKLGPNATNEKVITRYCKAITVNKTLLENFERSCKIIRRSGKHVTGSMTMDLQRVVKELMKHDALKPTPGRKYKFFTDMDPTLLRSRYAQMDSRAQGFYSTTQGWQIKLYQFRYIFIFTLTIKFVGLFLVMIIYECIQLLERISIQENYLP